MNSQEMKLAERIYERMVIHAWKDWGIGGIPDSTLKEMASDSVQAAEVFTKYLYGEKAQAKLSHGMDKN